MERMKKNNLTNISHSSSISVVVFVFYYLWFVFLDRRLIFLYGHMHHTPFDVFTASRHWMTGFVVSGVILILYTGANLFIRKFGYSSQLPDWKIVWKYSCLILILPLLALLIFTGKPPMPVLLSLWILVVLFTGLRLALYASNFIVTNFRPAIWLFFDGLALMPAFTVLAPSVAYGLRRSLSQGIYIIILPLVVIGLGLFWFWILTLLFKRFKHPYPSLTDVFLSGLTMSYILLPLVHYVGSRPGYVRYITNSENFIPNSFWLQFVALLVATGMVCIVGRWRKVVDFIPVKTLVFSLIVFFLVSSLVTGIVTGKETDIWLCQDDEWVKQGNPPYEKPFQEECGIVDKAMGM